MSNIGRLYLDILVGEKVSIGTTYTLIVNSVEDGKTKMQLNNNPWDARTGDTCVISNDLKMQVVMRAGRRTRILFMADKDIPIKLHRHRDTQNSGVGKRTRDRPSF